MKRRLASSELPLGKNGKPTKSPKIVPLIIITTFLLTIILLYFSYFHNELSLPNEKLYLQRSNRLDRGNTAAVNLPRPENPPHNSTELGKVSASQTIVKNPDIGPIESPNPAQRTSVVNKQCDLFTGEWVPNPDGPYYTNLSCGAIQDHQNCMKYGRPDSGFLKWRWKPDDCELPVFDPTRFLELMRGKSMAFVGDSVARNHMQSLICLLSRVAYPLELSYTNDQNKFYMYQEHNFNLSFSWAPYLVKYENTGPVDEKAYFRLYLDEPDPTWPTKIESVDYIIISAGTWFFRPTYFYLNHSLVACQWCPESESNITHLTYSFSCKWAFQTALRTINDVVGFNGVTFLRTYAPFHYEGGEWDNGGNCVRTRPFMRNQTTLKDRALDVYLMQLEELRIAQKAGRKNSGNFRLFDTTKAMLLRPDGHPSKYGHFPGANVRVNDCVHWCLPGPIDSSNDILQELLMREIES